MSDGPGSGISALEILKWIANIAATIIGGYLLYAIRSIFTRMKDLEDGASDQRVINQKFEDYQVWKDIKDKEFAALLEKISSKIDKLGKSFDERFIELTKSIHRLELKYEGQRSLKK